MTDFGLSPGHTFDSFLVSKSNAIAHAASIAVVSNPSTKDNPLFIYGATGTGKTHLLQAIGHAAQQSSRRISCQTSEELTSLYIKALQANAVSEFRAEISEFDFLMIDDIHFLVGKERTQQEFVQMFDTSISRSKRIVLTADRCPRELLGMNRDLIGLFESGLVVGLDTADKTLKISILRQRALRRGTEIPDGVLSRIASACSNARELEGALNRLVAEESLLKAR